MKVNEKADLIWKIADKLQGTYKPHEYGEVILPMTILRRFDSALEASKEAVLTSNEKLGSTMVEDLRIVKLEQISGYKFYNTSPFTLKTLLQDAGNISVNLNKYIEGFSKDVREIMENFNFNVEIEKMSENNLLYLIIQEFSKEDLHPDNVTNIDMGYIFEELIRKFSEAHNEEAGQHYTPREVIQLMVNLLFMEEDLSKDKEIRTIYDPACGTGGMLTEAVNYVKQFNATMSLASFGQEINAQTYAICKADILIKGEEAERIKKGDTLANDKFEDLHFDYVISNPPFGREWKVQKNAVEQEAKKGFSGRFGAGLPAIRDGQMLFLQAAIAKMKPEGSRVAIVHNGSPLFTGDAGSGESEIRRYILEHDLLEAIVSLPNDLFYNTGIATYIWVLSNKKAAKRKNKVQLINANGFFVKRRKSLGSKRNDISPKMIAEITKLYGEFKETKNVKIFDTTDFGYHKVIIERPKRDEHGEIILKAKKVQADSKRRDTEKIPLKEDITAYFEREVKPFAEDAWIDEGKTKVGYEIPFTRYFYEYEPLRESADIKDEILAIETELDGLIKELLLT